MAGITRGLSLIHFSKKMLTCPKPHKNWNCLCLTRIVYYWEYWKKRAIHMKFQLLELLSGEVVVDNRQFLYISFCVTFFHHSREFKCESHVLIHDQYRNRWREGLWDKSKNLYLLRNHIIPKSNHRDPGTKRPQAYYSCLVGNYAISRCVWVFPIIFNAL